MRRRTFQYLLEAATRRIFPEDMVTSRRQFVLIYAVRLVFLVGRRLWHDRCPRQAAALSYQTLLAIVPMLFIALAITGFFNIEFYVDEVIRFVETHLLPDAARSASRHIRQTAAAIRPRTLGLLGGIGFLLISVTLIFTVESVVNDIFRCARGRKLFSRALLALMLVLVIPGSLSFSLYHAGRILFWAPGIPQITLPAIATIGSLFLCFWRLPHCRIHKRHALSAAFVTGVGMEAAKWGFTFYARQIGDTLSYTYGTLAILPLFMVWVYLIWLIFLFGAEFSAALHEVRRHDRLDRGLPGRDKQDPSSPCAT